MNTHSTTEKADAPAELRASGTVKQGRRPMYVSHEDARKAAEDKKPHIPTAEELLALPWVVTHWPNEFWIHAGEGANSCVCTVQQRGDYEEIYGSKIADLIVAGPDLLKACKLTLANLAPKYCNDHLVMQSLRDAIAKAEGKRA